MAVVGASGSGKSSLVQAGVLPGLHTAGDWAVASFRPQLHRADCALHRARLFRDRAALTQARDLIESCGYGRRLPELEDAERAAADWPASTP